MNTATPLESHIRDLKLEEEEEEEVEQKHIASQTMWEDGSPRPSSSRNRHRHTLPGQPYEPPSGGAAPLARGLNTSSSSFRPANFGCFRRLCPKPSPLTRAAATLQDFGEFEAGIGTGSCGLVSYMVASLGFA